MNQLMIGEALKEQGQARAAMSAAEWHDAALDWIRALPAGRRLSADDLVQAVGLPRESEPNRNNAVGAVFTGARRMALITRDGWIQSRRPEGHGRVIALWRRA